jgi:hypothetical protein
MPVYFGNATSWAMRCIRPSSLVVSSFCRRADRRASRDSMSLGRFLFDCSYVLRRPGKKRLAFPCDLRANSRPRLSYNEAVKLMEVFDSESIQRLGQQSRFLLRIHRAELAKDPLSHATKSSRSNLMPVQHTVKEMYGEAVGRDVMKP